MVEALKPNAKFEDIQAALTACMRSDVARFISRLGKLRKTPDADARERLVADINASLEKVHERRELLPTITYPELPVSARRDEIIEAIRDNQVIVICGETGSGKTTQLPKLAMEAGCGIRGLIGHTQPRRIAARSVANRIAEELQTTLGDVVGYKIRFTDQTSANTYIKLMTDGVLLAEAQHDRWLNQYDTIIIDEAHERSLNIDFLLGYLRQLADKRPELKIIITSATIDPDRFSRHFNNAPVLMVSGRTYPVEVLYRPMRSREESRDDTRGLVESVADAVDEVTRIDRGDILIFMSGEREIREVSDFLSKRNLQNTSVLPLFSRLSRAEQDRIFATSSRRKIVISTNVAETSLTVPGIRFVIDSGLARISRYSYRSKVQRLPIEKISQASADQRKGRCGRVGPGVCVRLYGEDDFIAREEFTPPEILRTNLASVILQMEALKLGAIEDFPFIDPPDGRFVRDGYKLLFELGAMDEYNSLTKLGKKLARLPVDPRIGRMVLAGDYYGCVQDVLVLAAFLSVQDPRERPMDKQQAADEAHAAFKDERSDFVSVIKLWRDYQKNAKALGSGALKRYLRDHFLSYLRMREWLDVHNQLKQLAKELELTVQPEREPDYEKLHRALLTGLTTQIGCRIDGSENKQQKGRRGPREYQAVRNGKFQLFPGSHVAKKPPPWVMASEIVETGKVYARMAAQIEPAWVEQAAEHLLKKTYFEPYWAKGRGEVLAYASMSLYGLIVNPKKAMQFAKVAPDEAHEIFVRRALVEGQMRCNLGFVKHNAALLEEVEALEAKTRRRDVRVSDDRLCEWFSQRVPQDICSQKHFEIWAKQEGIEKSKRLYLSKDDVIEREADASSNDYPDKVSVNGIEVPLEYAFSGRADGVTAIVPMALLNQLEQRHFEWLVPGLLREKVTELIRSLPKSLRRNFVPAPNYAEAFLATGNTGPLLPSLSQELKRMTGIEVPEADWNTAKIPEHLQMNLRVLGTKGEVLAEGRDLLALQEEHGRAARSAFKQMPQGEGDAFERGGLKRWDFGDVPEFLELDQGGLKLRGYPALVDQITHVDLKLLDSDTRAAREHHFGVRRLFILTLNQQVKYLERNLPGYEQMCLQFTKAPGCPDCYRDELQFSTKDQNAKQILKNDLVTHILDKVFMNGPAVRTEADFQSRVDEGRTQMIPYAETLGQMLKTNLAAYHEVTKALKGGLPLQAAPAVQDIQSQLDHLIFHGFIGVTAEDNLRHLGRYLKAIALRLERLKLQPAKDKERQAQISKHWQQYLQRQQKHVQRGIRCEHLRRYRWMIEEYRVSIFAQELKTAQPVSDKRLAEVWSNVAA